MTSHPTVHSDDKAALTRTIAAASAIGTTIEWYDFLIYGTAATLVLNKLFFPTQDPLVGQLISISTIGVGFFARPLGAVILSHFGDRLGRKSMLIVTLVSMGVATALIGLLPTYASIGIAAPVLLVACRLVQGIAVGGEWRGLNGYRTLSARETRPIWKSGSDRLSIGNGARYGIVFWLGFPRRSAIHVLGLEDTFRRECRAGGDRHFY
jgi:MFS family permease